MVSVTLLMILMLLAFLPVSFAGAEGRDGPYISVQPQNAEVSSGESASFSVVAAGTGTLSYQWYWVDGGGEGRDAPVGGNSATYETGAVTTENTGRQYYVIVRDDLGSATSNTATLTVTEGLSITTQPADKTVISGTSATFTVEAAGDAPYTYQWYLDMNTGSWAARGGSEPSFSTNAVTAEQDGWKVYVHITGFSGASLDSNIATLHVIQGFAFTTQPQNARVITGGMATFTADAVGLGELTYQWYVDTGDGRWSAVGTGGKSYTTPALTMDYSGYLYMCRVSGESGRSLDSDTATLTVILPSPSITSDPGNASASIGETAAFSIEAQGDEPLSYLWSIDRGDGRWSELASDGDTYTTEPVTLAYDGYRYRCTVSDANGRSKTSEAATLHVLKPLTITTQPRDISVADGSVARFSIRVEGEAPFNYQWSFPRRGRKTWKSIGDNAASLSVSTELVTKGKLLVYCLVTDAYSNELQSRTAVMTLVPDTGDSARPWFWTGSLILSLGLLSIVLRRLRKRDPSHSGRA